MVSVLFVNHYASQCGVFEFGKNIGKTLEKSPRYKFKYVECNSYSELSSVYSKHKPQVIIYNYHPQTLSWASKRDYFNIPLIFRLNAIHVGIIHEVYQHAADQANDSLFDFHIAPDPTLLLRNQLVYKTGRLLSGKTSLKIYKEEQVPVIGSFGFATGNKGFDRLVELVQNEFDEAVIRLNIPFSTFADKTGEMAHKTTNDCRNKLTKPGIKLHVTHDYFSDNELREFLEGNTVNVFMYNDGDGRGISSVPDTAIVCGRPLAVNRSKMFRHLHNLTPSICIEDLSLRKIIKNGIEPLKPLWEEWSPEILIWDYERIVTDIINKSKPKTWRSHKTFTGALKRKLKNRIRPSNNVKQSFNIWTQSSASFVEVHSNENAIYKPIDVDVEMNVILDSEKRKFYEPAIKFFNTYLSDLLIKKIPEANVQQAFVFDSVVRSVPDKEKSKLLAVGAFEDTAYLALKILNYSIVGIDPVLNYDLATYLSKPNVTSASYDVILSTSVIEHVKDDEKFIEDVAYLLKPGGVAILTCDFSNSYKPGDDIPSVDFRFYTKQDLRNRLLNLIPDCELIGRPNWDCENPDFVYLNRYHYTFATFAFRKKAV